MVDLIDSFGSNSGLLDTIDTEFGVFFHCTDRPVLSCTLKSHVSDKTCSSMGLISTVSWWFSPSAEQASYPDQRALLAVRTLSDF
jgi:hypothetical protein